MINQRTRNTVAVDLLKESHSQHTKFIKWVQSQIEKDGIERKITRRKAREFLREYPNIRAIQISMKEKEK